MSIVYQSAQVIGFIGTALSLAYLHRKNMKNILIMKMMIDIVWALHYAMLSAYTGLFVNLICLLREITFLRNKGEPQKYQLLIFVALNCINSWLTWESAYSILPAVGGILATYSFWQKRVARTRFVALLNNILFFTYDVCRFGFGNGMRNTYIYFGFICFDETKI